MARENDADQYLTFTLDGETYAVSVLKVREVLEHSRITRIPKTAAYMKGLINVRGTGVPVIDLRMKFGIAEAPDTSASSIIVMEIASAGERSVFGAIADSVQEVISMEADRIEPPPRFGTRLSAEFIQGIGTREGSFVIILNIDKILDSEEVAYLNELEGTPPPEEQGELSPETT